jgi:hypothetical protein
MSPQRFSGGPVALWVKTVKLFPEQMETKGFLALSGFALPLNPVAHNGQYFLSPFSPPALAVQ